MTRELDPGSERGKKEAMAAMYEIADGRFTELFLAGQGYEEKVIDGAFVFYIDDANGELIELNEIMEPTYMTYRAKRSVIVYDVKKSNGQYHVSYKGDESSWSPETGFESFESVQENIDLMSIGQYSLLQRFAVTDPPVQNPDGNSTFRGVARTHKVLGRELRLIDQSEIFKPEIA